MGIPEEQKRFYAIKLFERDDKITDLMQSVPDVSDLISRAEEAMDDDAESIITNERYTYISSIIKDCYKKKRKEKAVCVGQNRPSCNESVGCTSDFAAVMFIVYYVSVTTVGTWATDWANDGLFGDGFHLFGIGSAAYEESVGEYDTLQAKIDAYLEAAEEEIDLAALTSALEAEEPDPAQFGVWVPSIPVLVESGLDAVGTADWLKGLIFDGIIAGVGAVLGFVPQMLVLFLFLAFLEACGYMARIAFIMDRLFRKFGLSGKSFIPMLIGTGCGVPGIMASRTIENDRDRKMTIMTTTFIPCGAKLPIIALIAGALFGGAWWVAPSAYFVGIAAIIISGIILKKTKMFAGDPAPFVMELPAYHWPTVGNVLRSMWSAAGRLSKGRYGNPAVYNFYLVCIKLWYCGRTVWYGRRPKRRLFGIYRQRNCVAVYPTGLGKLAGAVAAVMALSQRKTWSVHSVSCMDLLRLRKTA